MQKIIIIVLIITLIHISKKVDAQQDTIFITTSLDSAVNKKNFFEPDIDGCLKTKVEYDFENSLIRFQVRNARFGARGKVNNYFSYRAEVDLSDEGEIKMLDAFVKITPIKDLDLYLGQRKVPFGSDYLRSPVDNFFANRSFVAKYTNNGIRDIGFITNYKLPTHLPVSVWIGFVNGTGNNNPQWIKNPNFSTRIEFEPYTNFRVVGNLYTGESINQTNIVMVGGEMRYQNKYFLIETEILNKSYNDTLNFDYNEQGVYIHSYYNFFTNYKLLKTISPTLRWDKIAENILEKGVAERFTLGLNFGFEPKMFFAEIRLNYENYFLSKSIVHTDKATIEFIAKF